MATKGKKILFEINFRLILKRVFLVKRKNNQKSRSYACFRM